MWGRGREGRRGGARGCGRRRRCVRRGQQQSEAGEQRGHTSHTHRPAHHAHRYARARAQHRYPRHDTPPGPEVTPPSQTTMRHAMTRARSHTHNTHTHTLTRFSFSFRGSLAMPAFFGHGMARACVRRESRRVADWPQVLLILQIVIACHACAALHGT